jgi:hypothetical protein
MGSSSNFDNPLSHAEDEEKLIESVDKASLPDVARGRLFCWVHGRVCYRQFSVTGENEWICPDERHFDKLNP